MAAQHHITRISWTPVKGMKIASLEETEVTRYGIPGDRAFYLVDSRRRMVNAKRFGGLLMIEPSYDLKAGFLRLTFPDGTVCEETVETGDFQAVSFFGQQAQARPVAGPFSQAISEFIGEDLRLVARPDERPAVDRGEIAGISLLGTASVARLEEAAAENPNGTEAGPAREAIDRRRFRMSIEFDGGEPHSEDGWIGHRLRAGEALLHVNGHVGRCAVTTRNPETAERDLAVLRLLQTYRDGVMSEEPLPFGVYAAVRQPGMIRVGDPVGPAG